LNAIAMAQTWLVLVTGLGGSPLHRAGFEAQAAAIAGAAQSRLGIPRDRIVVLGEGTRPRADSAGVGAALRSVAARAAPGSLVVVVLLGHGSAVSGPRFHLPGPDLTPVQMAAMLAAFRSQEVVVVNAASASGPWIEPLAGPRRTIITATRSGNERDETVFGRYFASAFAGDTADTDKDGRLSVLELFEHARLGVERDYRERRRLRTEHALLEDDGDGRGSLTASADSGDGQRAARLYLNSGVAAAAEGEAALAPLLARRDSLERAVAALRARRAAMDSLTYESELERLLLRAAEVGREIRARSARP
jgi:hypothetical protein